MRKKYVYLIQRIRGSEQWPEGITIWALQPCKGWRVIAKKPI